MSHFTDVRVAESDMTSSACPEQYSGTLVDGQPFYFRYRSGYASLAVGADCEGRRDVGVEHGDRLQGIFDSAEDRDRVFTQLLDEAMGGAR